MKEKKKGKGSREPIIGLETKLIEEGGERERERKKGFNIKLEEIKGGGGDVATGCPRDVRLPPFGV